MSKENLPLKIGGGICAGFALLALQGLVQRLFFGVEWMESEVKSDTDFLVIVLVWGFVFLLMAIPFGFFRYGYRKGRERLLPLKQGVCTIGRITSVTWCRRIEHRGGTRTQWAILYAFEVEGHEDAFTGEVRTWDEMASRRNSDEPVYVLYLPQNPKEHALYPPVR